MKSGASLQAKNTNNKTPREEVELVTSLKGAQTSGSGESDLDPDYYKTLSFLLEQEEKFEQAQGIFLKSFELLFGLAGE